MYSSINKEEDNENDTMNYIIDNIYEKSKERIKED